MAGRWIMLICLSLTACATQGTPSASPASITPTPEAGVVLTSEECSGGELLLPDGTILNLSGTWISSNSALFHLYQSGRCLWWEGGDPEDPALPVILNRETMVFEGRIRTDFTVIGHWAFVMDPPDRRWGTATLKIELQDDGTVRLIPIATTGRDSGWFSSNYYRPYEGN